jgi:hypothetical protein
VVISTWLFKILLFICMPDINVNKVFVIVSRIHFVNLLYFLVMISKSMLKLTY